MRRAHLSSGQATLVGTVAVVLWSLLAVLTVATAPVPPLQLNAMTFAIGGCAGLVLVLASGRGGQLRGLDWRACILGTAGLFGYHALYFSALRMAPPAQAGLIAYLWPLLIVLLSGLLPGERLGAAQVAGAVLAFAGAALILLPGGSDAGSGAVRDAGALPGYGLALICAFVWAAYSVGSRKFAHVPTEAVIVYCLATALLSALAHLALERTVWPASATGWLACLALGLGPVGLAFLAWDVGMKRGHIQMLGVLSYAAPLLSTLVLVISGTADATATLGAAAALIVAGALLAASGKTRGGS